MYCKVSRKALGNQMNYYYLLFMQLVWLGLVRVRKGLGLIQV